MSATAQKRVRVTVLGAGSWGSALAALACAHADTVLWARDAALVQGITANRINDRYLPGVVLPNSLQCTADFDQAMAHVLAPDARPALIILGVPVASLADLCARVSRALDTQSASSPTLIWTCKGFHHETGQLPHEIAQAALAAHPETGLGVLSGPSFAREVAQGLPVALTIASRQPQVADVTTAALHGGSARIYTSTDMIGVEVGGALKNVMAIACGIADGLGLGTNARAALITRGLAEMQRLGQALGGQPETFAGLTGLGDLVLTATGPLSRNRQVGLAIGQGQTLDAILAQGMTAEGVRCAQAVLTLGQKHSIDLPITEAVCNVLFHGVAPKHAVTALLAREARAESHHKTC